MNNTTQRKVMGTKPVSKDNTITRKSADNLKNNAPNVYDSDLGVMRGLSNTKFNVSRITNADAVAEVQRANEQGTLEVRFIDQASYRDAYDTPYGTRNIGSDKLQGITAADQYVLYDSSTGKYYRCANDNDEDYVATKKEYDTTKRTYDAYVTDLKKGQEAYENALKNSTGDAYYATLQNYQNFYNSATENINKLSVRMNELEQFIIPNEAYKKSVDESLAAYRAAKEEVDKYSNLVADINDPHQHNSIVDVVKTAVVNIGDKDYWDALEEALEELCNYTLRPLFDTSVDLDAGQRALILGVNSLVNLGETTDIVGINVKALINARTKGMTPVQALKSVYGLYGDGGYYNWDYDTGNLGADLILEIVSDPVNWFTLGSKAIATSTAKTAAKESLRVTVKELGLDVSEEMLDKLARKSIKYAVRNTDKPTRELLVDLLTRELSSMDVHTQIAKLGSNAINFKEADRLAALLIKSGKMSGDALQSSASLQRYLSHTNLSPQDITKIIDICNTSYIKNLGVITNSVEELTKLKAFRVVDAARAIESFDSKFTKLAIDLTVPGVAPAKLLVKTGKALKNSGLPEFVSKHVLDIFKKVNNSARVVDDLLGAEAAMGEVYDEFRTIERYIRTLNMDKADEVLNNLSGVEANYYKHYYNQMVSDVIDMFDEQLKKAIVEVTANSALTDGAKVEQVFNLVAADITGGQFSYADLFAFVLNNSRFAEYLNSANKAKLSKLEWFRNSAYLKASATTANTLFVKVNDALDGLSRGLHNITTGMQYQSFLDMSEFMYSLNDVADNAANNKEAVSKAMKSLNSIYDKLGKTLQNNPEKTASITKLMYTSMEKLYKALNAAYEFALNPVRLSRAQEDFEAYLTMETLYATSKNTTSSALTRALNNHGLKDVQITASDIASTLVTDLDSAHLKADTDYAVIEAGKLIKKEVVLNNEDIIKAYRIAVSDDSVIGRVLNNAAMYSDYYNVVHGTGVMHTIALEAEFQNGLTKMFGESDKLIALKDTLADDGVRTCNSIISTTDFTQSDSIQNAVNRITDKLVSDAQEYLQGITPASKNINMYFNTLEDGTTVTFNSGSTAANVLNMRDHFSDFLSRAIDRVADESARDVLYSITHVNANGEPIQVSLLDMQTNTLRTFTLQVGEELLDIADNAAYKMYGVGTAKFKADYLSGDMGEVFTNATEYYDSISAFITQIASHTDGKHIRYVGFNTGVVQGGQAKALKNVFSRYGMVSGQFVDLADELRQIDFKDTYLTDFDITKLRWAVEKHVNNIGKVVVDTDNTMVKFGTEVTDLVNMDVWKISQDLIKFVESPEHTTDYIAPYIISSAIDTSDVQTLAVQAHWLDDAFTRIYSAIGSQGVLDEQPVIINMQALKELYESKTASKLNIMNMLSSNIYTKNLNLRYVVRKDVLNRWMKSTVVENASATELMSYYETYKRLLGFEARIKDTHIADMLDKTELLNLYYELVENPTDYAKYDDLFTKLAGLDLDKLNNAQMLSVLFSVRRYTNFLDTSDAAMRGATLERTIVDEYENFLAGGFAAINIRDLTRYSKTATMYNIVEDVSKYADTLDNAVDDINSLEAYFKMIDKSIGSTAEGREYALLHELLADVEVVQSQVYRVRAALHSISSVMQESSEDYVRLSKQYREARAQYKEFVDMLKAHNDEVISNALRNVYGLSDEQLTSHIIANCAGTMLIQLDGDMYKANSVLIDDLHTRISRIPALDMSTKMINYNGADHLALVITAGSSFDGAVLRDALQAAQEFKPTVTDKMFKSVVNNLPTAMKYSDYTPANAAATMRVLEFAGVAKKEARDLVELMQRYDVFNVGFNCNVIGDTDFVKQFYTYKSNDLLRTLQQTVTHGITKLGSVTYYKALLTGNFFRAYNFARRSESYEMFSEYVKKFHYVLCTLDDTGKPVPVTLTRNLYKDITQRGTKVQCMPVEFFKEAITAFEDIADANKSSRRAGLSYVAGYLSQAMERLSVMRKQGWLFTHVSTAINNAIGGLTTAVSDAGLGLLAKFPTVVVELDKFKRIYAAMLEEYPHINDDVIRQFFSSSELRDLMPEKTFRNYLTVALMGGNLTDAEFTKMLSTQAAKLANEAVNINELQLTKAQLAEFTDYIQSICKDLNSAYNRHYDSVRNIYDYAAVQKDLNKFFENQNSPWAEYAQTVAMRYLAERKPAFDVSRIPVLGKWYNFNQNMFSTVEEYLRNTLVMHFIDNGYSTSEAVARMLNTQFDYSDSSKFMRMLNAAFPFSTYKLMNLKYWLFDEHTRGHALRLMANLGQYQGIIDPVELAGSIYWTNYYKEHADDEDMDECPSIIEQLTTGHASSQMYVSRNGKIPLPGNHYLKNSAPTFEALELYQSMLLAVTDYDAFKELVSDNVYSPISTLAELLVHLDEHGSIDAQYYADNYYAINDLIPVYGMLVNDIIARIKAGNLNFSNAELSALYATGKVNAETILEAGFDGLATIWTSMIGTYKTSKPVGYDWNNQSDEYKATHRYIYGVSSVPTIFTKNPATYVDHMGMLMELGFTKDEAVGLLKNGWYFDLDGNVHQYKLYTDEEMPDKFKYNADVFDNTLRYLLARGYDIDSAYTYMKSFGKWVDDDGTVRSLNDVEDLWESSAAAREYKMLPAYIRNMPNQYSDQLAYYKALGYTSEQAKYLMHHNTVLIIDGEAHNLAPSQVYELNKLYKYNLNYEPDYNLAVGMDSYISNTVNGSAKYNKFNMNAVTKYSTPVRQRTTGGRQYQASSFPSSYRASRRIRHSFTYKDVYGLNNIANNKMRTVMAHTHYRSANRYRAEMVRNLFKY